MEGGLVGNGMGGQLLEPRSKPEHTGETQGPLRKSHHRTRRVGLAERLRRAKLRCLFCVCFFLVSFLHFVPLCVISFNFCVFFLSLSLYLAVSIYLICLCVCIHTRTYTSLSVSVSVVTRFVRGYGHRAELQVSFRVAKGLRIWS